MTAARIGESLPVVSPTQGPTFSSPAASSAGSASVPGAATGARAPAPHPITQQGMATADGEVPAPVLQWLATSAGESLRSLVAPLLDQPVHSEPAGMSEHRELIRPVPTAAPTLVNTSPRSAPRRKLSGARAGGGEPEIPAWFESAARRMLDDRGDGDGISLAEMTLVNAAPARHVAASSESAASSAPSGGGGGSGGGEGAGNQGEDEVESLAEEVYEEVLRMLQIAGARIGDPWRS